MNWRAKALALHVLSVLPRGVHRRIKRQFLNVPYYLKFYQLHVAQYQRIHPGVCLEFGAGQHLLSPLLLSAAGATEVIVYDIERMATAATVNHTIEQLRAILPERSWPSVTTDDDLLDVYRIRYLAPADVSRTGLPDDSVDFICTTDTLEHIPPGDLNAILAECCRVAKPGAIFSHYIDYNDHFAYAQKSLSPFNFYRYSDRAWTLWNPSNHFQNRLRHSDYERLFAAHGLATTHVSTIVAAALAVPVSSRFADYAERDLRTQQAHFVLASSQELGPGR